MHAVSIPPLPHSPPADLTLLHCFASDGGVPWATIFCPPCLGVCGRAGGTNGPSCHGYLFAVVVFVLAILYDVSRVAPPAAQLLAAAAPRSLPELTFVAGSRKMAVVFAPQVAESVGCSPRGVLPVGARTCWGLVCSVWLGLGWAASEEEAWGRVGSDSPSSSLWRKHPCWCVFGDGGEGRLAARCDPAAWDLMPCQFMLVLFAPLALPPPGNGGVRF